MEHYLNDISHEMYHCVVRCYGNMHEAVGTPIHVLLLNQFCHAKLLFSRGLSKGISCVLKLGWLFRLTIDLSVIIMIIMRFINILLAPFTVVIGQGIDNIYERKLTLGDCDRVLTGSFRQVPVRSEVGCILFADSLHASGFYYTSSTEICNICKFGSSATLKFTKINMELGYLSERKLKFIVCYSC